MRRLFRPERLLTLALVAACAGIVAYWVLILGVPRMPVAPSSVPSQIGAAPDTRAAARLFGSTERPIVAAAASNVQVFGIVTGRRAVAVLAVDGLAPRAVALGDEAKPGMRLIEVNENEVVLEQAGRRLVVPAPAKSSVDVLDSGPAIDGALPSGASGGTVVLANDTEAAAADTAGSSARAATLPPRPLPPHGAAAGGRSGVSSRIPRRTTGVVGTPPQSAVRASPPRAAPR